MQHRRFPLPVLVLLAWSSSARRVTTKARELSVSYDEKVETHKATKPAPFSVMQWNILSDGLSTDGFVANIKNYKVADLVERMVETSEALLSNVGSIQKQTLKDYGACAKAELTVPKPVLTCAKARANCVKTTELIGAQWHPMYPFRFSGQFLLDCETLKQKPEIAPYFTAIEKIDQDFKMRKYTSELTKFLQWGATAAQEDEMTPGEFGIGCRTGEGIPLEKSKCRMKKYLKKKTGDRGIQIAAKILSIKPDIVALEELDHLAFMQKALGNSRFSQEIARFTNKRKLPRGYKLVNSIAPNGEYKYWSLDEAEKDMKDPNSCSNEDVKFAFSRKFDSNSKMMHVNGNPQHNDDEGSAIFWNPARFTALAIKRKCYNGKKTKDGGVVGVLLQDKSETNKYLWAFSTHLSSGDEKKKEVERVEQITTVAAFISEKYTSTKELLLVLNHQKTNDTLASLVKESLVKTAKIGIVLLMDGNTHPLFANDDFTDINDINMYNTLVSLTSESQIPLVNFLEKTNAGDPWKACDNNSQQVGKTCQSKPTGRTDLPMKLRVSVNKIRGIGSEQLKKVGQYQLDCIDYIATHGLNWKKNPSEKLDLQDRSNLKEAYKTILPSEAVPSDHHPVVGLLEWQ